MLLFKCLKENIMKIISYLDNSATTKQYDNVTNVMMDAITSNYGNPSSLHTMGFENSKNLKIQREKIACALGNNSLKVIFTSSGSESNNLAIKGMADTKKRNKGIIVTSAIEHAATSNTIDKLAEDGWGKSILEVDPKGLIDIASLEAKILNENVPLVSILQVNNEVGTIQPIKRIDEIISKVNKQKTKEEITLLHVDAVQSFKKIMFEMNNIDMISISSHKIHGPKGVAALAMKSDLRVIPQIHGGGQEFGIRSGTENVPGIMGFGEAATTEVDLEKIKNIRDTLLEQIKLNIPDIKINSPEKSSIYEIEGLCAPHILNISFLGIRGEVLLHLLEDDGIFVSTGSACSSNKKGKSHVLKAMKLKDEEIEGAIRFSVGALNQLSEVDYVVEKLKIHVERMRKLRKK